MKWMKQNYRFLASAPLLWAWAVVAQGSTTYLSDLDPLASGQMGVASDVWLTKSFYTGTNAAGYQFDALRLALADSAGSPAGFSVALYRSASSGVFPGDKLVELSGSLNPVFAGIYEFYYAGPPLLLPPRIQYFIVLTAAQLSATGSYGWRLVGTPPANGIRLDGWNGGFIASSTNGVVWGRINNVNGFQFSVTATTVPEPAAAILLLSGGAVLWFYRKVKVP